MLHNALLVVDLQLEFVTDEKTRAAYQRVLKFVKEANSYDIVIATAFVRGNPNYKRLLNYNFPENPAPLEFACDRLIPKTGYGLTDMQYINFSRNYHYDIVGCETDACILKIAMDLFDREYSFSVLYPQVFTSADIPDKALRTLLKRNLGAAVKF